MACWYLYDTDYFGGIDFVSASIRVEVAIGTDGESRFALFPNVALDVVSQ